jgi:hypothetical protein
LKAQERPITQADLAKAGHAQFVSKHAADATVNGEVLPWLYNGSDIANFGLTNAGELADNSLYEQHQFTQNKKLSLIDSSFSKGILSKLYNGQMRCDAWNSYAYLELDETGYGAYFPKELTSSKYFAMVVRGGSNTPDGTGRLSELSILSLISISIPMGKQFKSTPSLCRA